MPPSFLQDLAVVLGAAALIALVCQRLRLPLVVGYLLAGMIIGPNVPIPLVADQGTVNTLSQLGVILLMFSLGLNFSLRQLLRLMPTMGIVSLMSVSLLIWLGFLVGRALGWTVQESLFAGVIVALSSDIIVIKALGEERIPAAAAELAYAELVIEDLIAIVLIAVMTAIASGHTVSADTLVSTMAQLLAFLVLSVFGGLLIVPRMIRGVIRLARPEVTVLACVAVCFALALLAQAVGYSVALGAFIGGMLIGESGAGPHIELLVRPLRDVFGAVFFVSVGMLIDPALLAEHWAAVLSLTLLVLVGKPFGVFFGSFLMGNGARSSLIAGLTVAQIGEFSYILASVGLAWGATGDHVYPIAVAVSVITALTTPYYIRASGAVATFLGGRVPQPLQTFATLYGSWIERLRQSPHPRSTRASMRRLLSRMGLDAVVLAAILIGTSLGMDSLRAFLGLELGLSYGVATTSIVLAAALVSVPFVVGLVRITGPLSALIAGEVLPAAREGQLDLADAPRRALVITLRLTMLLLVGLPLIAITQPFLPRLPVAVLLVGALTLVGVVFWRRATNLQGHVRAGAQVIIEALATPDLSRPQAPMHTTPASPLEQVQALLPGIGNLAAVTLVAHSPAVGRTMRELNLQTLTGVTVLAILRGRAGLVPTGNEPLEAGDVLALTGPEDAVEAARALLHADEPSIPEPSTSQR